MEEKLDGGSPLRARSILAGATTQKVENIVTHLCRYLFSADRPCDGDSLSVCVQEGNTVGTYRQMLIEIPFHPRRQSVVDIVEDQVRYLLTGLVG
jgi:hypothetical protein